VPNTITRPDEPRRSAAAEVRHRVEADGERFWRMSDFDDLPPGAVARALSRLASGGTLARVQKGLYWRSRPTIVGPSVPGATATLAEVAHAPLHPAGLTAAHLLGLTTQNPMRAELATPGAAAPRIASRMTVHTRRPASRSELDMEEAALLELLRDRGRTSDLAPDETIRKVAQRLHDPARYGRLATAASAGEPPRVAAILGALGEAVGAPSDAVGRLRAVLNPLSTFDFGVFGTLPNARDWQAR
jgi:Family of unknown function (DUF6088)